MRVRRGPCGHPHGPQPGTLQQASQQVQAHGAVACDANDPGPLERFFGDLPEPLRVMSEGDSHDQERLTVVAVAGSEPEADVIRQRLEQAGIPAVAQRTIGGPEWGPSGSRYVYVRAPDEAHARRVLSSEDAADD